MESKKASLGICWDTKDVTLDVILKLEEVNADLRAMRIAMDRAEIAPASLFLLLQARSSRDGKSRQMLPWSIREPMFTFKMPRSQTLVKSILE